MEMEKPIYLLLFLLALLVHFLINKLLCWRSSPQLPPGPFAWPIIGNIFQLGRKPHVSLTNLALTYGELMMLSFGGHHVAVASSPEAAMQILRTHDRMLSGRYVPAVATKLAHESVFPSIALSEACDDAWRSLRSISISELFSAKAIESQANLREKKMMEMVDYLGRKEGEVVNLEKILFATTVNSISNIMVTRDLVKLDSDGGNERLQQLIRTIIEIVSSRNLADLAPMLQGLDVWCKRKARNILVEIKSLWNDIITERRERKDGEANTRDFLDALIQNGCSDDQICMWLMEFILAGTDNVWNTINWSLAHLLKHQEAMSKLCDELSQTTDGNVLRESHLPQMAYLDACIKETIRLRPPGPFLVPYRAVQACKVMNYTIPKDSILLVNFWAIGRDPTIWKDPLTYKPERFLETKLDFKGANFIYIPFGEGRRLCPGLNFVVTQVQLLVASLVYHFDWSLPHGMDLADLDLDEKFGLSMMKEKPLLLIPSRRKRSTG
ncbi:hypothetical protein RJ640_012471 [Escallonia rubra]|uniref:Cytochrome P450 n=1 Tax=Escallonia rubra TaxID=112253 RepID=A0AA88U9R7_9ASTE|nr:hypothetical protein RJ640_012471 [Escallonia rubra]